MTTEMEHERRLVRLEHVVLGTDEAPDKGLSARVLLMDTLFAEMKRKWDRIEMLIIIAIVSALLNLALSASRNGEPHGGEGNGLVHGEARTPPKVWPGAAPSIKPSRPNELHDQQVATP